MSFDLKMLDALITHQKGFAFKSEDYQSSGFPVVRVSNFTDDSIDDTDLKYVSETIFNSNLNVKLCSGDVVIATVGSWPTNPASIVGKTIRVPKKLNGALLNQNSVILRVTNKNKYDQQYLYYALKSKNFSSYLVSTAQGSANQASVTLTSIFKYMVEWPDESSRYKIAKILGDLDDKIALNTRINQTLEAMAQALFKSWFVNFDPVKSKMETRANGGDDNAVRRAAMAVISGKSAEELHLFEQKNPEAFAKLAETADLFPERLVESELGEIPEGWEVKTVGDFGKVITGKTPSKNIECAYTEIGIPFITPTDINDEIFVISTNRYLSQEGQLSVKNNLICAGSICVTCIGSQMGKAIIAPYDSYTNQQINSIIVKKGYFKNFLLLNLKRRREEIFLIGSSGSTMPIINKTTFTNLNVLKPSESLIESFDKSVSNLFDKIFAGDVENLKLAQTRDTLLPKLLSGEIDLSSFGDGEGAKIQ